MAIETKICTGCLLEQPIDNFRVDRSRKDGHQFRCKTCQITANSKPHRKASRKAYWERVKPAPKTPLTKEQKLEKNKQRRSTPKAKASKKAWNNLPKNREKNRNRQAVYRTLPSSKATRNKRDKERKVEDPQYKLTGLLRSRLKRAVAGNFKSGSAVDDLGCSVNFLKTHLESKFHPEMTWENHGKGRDKWNIDHIIPLSAFDLTNRQHVVLACNYLNLQPLWEEDNLLKREWDSSYVSGKIVAEPIFRPLKLSPGTQAGTIT